MPPNNLLFLRVESRLLEDIYESMENEFALLHAKDIFHHSVFKFAFPHSPVFTVPGRDTRALFSSIYVGIYLIS